jgi:Lrp/AsnC family transcriptional regulator, regulator for asnA, asnC and gidA
MKTSFGIDELDRKILSILTRNARVPFQDVAAECKISGAAVHQRVQRLIRTGIISGSQYTIDPKKLGFKTCAFVGIFLDNAALFNNVSEKLAKIPEITQCHYITGQYAMFLEVYAKDNDHLREVLADKIQSIKGVARTETFISLDVLIERQIPVLDSDQ